MKCILFTDGSVDPKQRIGFGAYLVLDEMPSSIDSLVQEVKIKRFEQTSSTQLELRTLLWALTNLRGKSITAYTDSQNILSLLRRKDHLTLNNFCSKSGKAIKNKELYQLFFNTIASMDIEFHWLNGHKPSKQKDTLDHLFTLVDRASRNALRSYAKEGL